MNEMAKDLKSMTAARASSVIIRDHDALKEMQAGRGWAIMSETLTRERERAIVALTTHMDTPKEVLDFHRATLRALDLMASLPDLVATYLKTELEIAKAYEAAVKGKD